MKHDFNELTERVNFLVTSASRVRVHIDPRHLRPSYIFLLPTVGFVFSCCICACAQFNSVYALLISCLFMVCDSALPFGLDHCTYLTYTILHLHLSSRTFMISG